MTYIAGRVRAAGGVPDQIFTHEAVALIHERANGIPRLINVIADNALLGGFAAGLKPVNSRCVRDVCQDFDLAPRVDEHVRRPASLPAATHQAGAGSDGELFSAIGGKRRRFHFFGD